MWISAIAVVLIICISIFAASFKKVEEGQACVKVNSRTGSVSSEPYLTASNELVGPDFEFICFPTTRQSISFADGFGLASNLTARTVEGLAINLQIDIEYRIVGEEVFALMNKFGEEFHGSYMRIARSTLRNVASEFEGLQYLRGERATIGERMREVLDLRLRQDHALVERVNIRDIHLDEAFEEAFRAVEEVRLDRLEALENRALAVVQEQRENETQAVELETARQSTLVAARALVVQAELAHTASITEATTAAARDLISEESVRQSILIAAEANVSRAEAQRDAAVTEATRVASERRLVANRQREVALIAARSLVLQAREQRETELEGKRAEIDLAERTVAAELIAANATAVGILADSNATATGRLATGEAEAEEARSRRLAQKGLLESMGAHAGVGADAALQYLWTNELRALVGSNQTTAFLDYLKQPLLAEAGAGADSTRASGAVTV